MDHETSQKGLPLSIFSQNKSEFFWKSLLLKISQKMLSGDTDQLSALLLSHLKQLLRQLQEASDS